MAVEVFCQTNIEPRAPGPETKGGVNTRNLVERLAGEGQELRCTWPRTLGWGWQGTGKRLLYSEQLHARARVLGFNDEAPTPVTLS